MTSIEDSHNRSTWLSTAASQICFMELGFLCIECGYVQHEYIQSLIIKNSHNVIIGFVTYTIFGFALSSLNYEYIALYNLPYSEWDKIFVDAALAAVSATIMSSVVLERMNNVAYSLWVCLVILINFSFVFRWVWNTEGWLFQLGFIDCAGCSVVHMTGGIGGFVLCAFLGPRYSSLSHIVNDPLDEATKRLKNKHLPRDLLIMFMGTLILWFGWIAFNASSPIIGQIGFDGDVGLAGLLTVILPAISAASTYVLSYMRWPNWQFLKQKGIKPGKTLIQRSSENLSKAILAGLVVATACCYTINLISAIIIGLFVPFPIFWVSSYLRSKCNMDDPLDTIAIHLFGAIIGLFVEGLFNFNNGLLTTGNYKHFAVQCLGITATLAFNIVFDVIFILIFKFIIFRNTDIKTTPLSICLSTSSRTNIYYGMDYGLAFRELMFGDTHLSRKVMATFHQYLKSVYCEEQLDFIIAVYHYRKLFDQRATLSQLLPSKSRHSSHASSIQMSMNQHHIISMTKSKSQSVADNILNINQQIQRTFNCISNLYIADNADKQINISSQCKRSIISIYDKSKKQRRKISYSVPKNQSQKDLIIICDNKENDDGDNKENGGNGSNEIYIIDQTVFNSAFMETLQHITTHLRVLLQQYHDNTQWSINRNTKHGKAYIVLIDTLNIKWFGDYVDPTNDDQNNDNKDKFTMNHHERHLSASHSHKHRQSLQISYVQSVGGRLKSVEQEINDILQ